MAIRRLVFSLILLLICATARGPALSLPEDLNSIAVLPSTDLTGQLPVDDSSELADELEEEFDGLTDDAIFAADQGDRLIDAILESILSTNESDQEASFATLLNNSRLMDGSEQSFDFLDATDADAGLLGSLGISAFGSAGFQSTSFGDASSGGYSGGGPNGGWLNVAAKIAKSHSPIDGSLLAEVFSSTRPGSDPLASFPNEPPDDPTVLATPEPASAIIWSGGLLCLEVSRRLLRRRRAGTSSGARC